MKINVLKRCESGRIIKLSAKDNAEAEKACEALCKDDHVKGARLVAFAEGDAIINYVGKFSRGAYDVPPEVAKRLIGLKYAEAIK